MAIDFPADVGPEDPDVFELERLAAEERFDNSDVTLTPEDVDPLSDEELAVLEAYQQDQREELARTYGPEQVGDADPEVARTGIFNNIGTTINQNVSALLDSNAVNGATAIGKANAQLQNTLSARVSQPASADWRVKLSLAQGANYLYQSSNPGILAPLARTRGVVFPYTPNIEMSYQAKYDAVDLTHSNYRGYFYKSSAVDTINIRCPFTAQDTREAEYMLAVIAFFRSVTKMFYGATDPLRGTPPPLVFLTGLGQYQFNNAPCVVSNFQYSLPNDVDYIRANGFNNYGVNLDNRRQQSSGPAGTGILGAIAQVNRLLNNGLNLGALTGTGSINPVSQNNSNTNYTNSTYVPTKMEISISLLPIQTRSQVSTQFNVQDFASGKLLQQGFW